MDELKIVVRPGTPHDAAFVSTTWADQMRFGNEFIHEVPEEFYYPWFQRKIGLVLKHPDTDLVVACDESNPTWIAGFAVFDPTSIYWVYVRDAYRKQGIASLLVKDRSFQNVKALIVTTRSGRFMIEKKNLKYQPL